jgi:prevent-host-death family protein
MMVIGSVEAKAKLSALLDKVERGEEVTITRGGRAVARLVPVVERDDAREKRAALEWIREFRRTHSTGGDDVKAWIEEGRR